MLQTHGRAQRVSDFRCSGQGCAAWVPLPPRDPVRVARGLAVSATVSEDRDDSENDPSSSGISFLCRWLEVLYWVAVYLLFIVCLLYLRAQGVTLAGPPLPGLLVAWYCSCWFPRPPERGRVCKKVHGSIKGEDKLAFVQGQCWKTMHSFVVDLHLL